MTVFIADIASYQKGLIPAALRPACVGLEIKCTQGASYVNPEYAGWLTASKVAGLITVPYHWIDGSAPAAQAANLKAHIIDPSLPVMLDFEESTLAQALAVADAMIAMNLRPKLLYFSRTRWKALKSPDLAAPLKARGLSLINAAYPSAASGTPAGLYPGDSAAGWTAYGGMSPALWQFTDRAVAAGQRIDMNAYRGSGAQFAALLGTPAPTANPSKPPAAPAALEEDEDDMAQIEPLSVHPGGYAFAFAPDKTTMVLVADGDKNPGAKLRVASWDGDSPEVETITIGGGSGHHVIGHPLRSGCNGVTIQRQDSQTYPIGVAFQ